ncbi:MAG: hypothetical protein IT209_12825 [Armatimonadetes bacterium]|nr:hypothetical protein [Armatimonadota bacterium]
MSTPSLTRWSTSDPQLDALWRRVVIGTVQDFGLRDLDSQIVTLGPAWLRDHVHELKGYKYFGYDMASGLEFFFRHQFEDGQFPDFFVPTGDQHVPFVTDEFKRVDNAHGQVYMRIPGEADLEYLAVEGVYQAWKASGNAEWLRNQMPALERGLHYLTTDRYRWNTEHQLVMRPHTVDTWDFTFFYSDDHFLTNCEIRRLDDSTPMAIFHGDNSGLYSAYHMMATLYRALGQDREAEAQLTQAEELKERANRLLWGDGFYIHMLHLDEETKKKYPDEASRLSLSNPYDINRGFTSHEQAVSIIDAYQNRWEANRDRYFTEWFTIDPPYNEQIAFFQPYEYVNGGLFATVGGELAKAAFRHGREEYGVDLLRRYYSVIKDRNNIGFMFYADGREYGGGPVGWCGAAYISALMEGLAGIEDHGSGFEDVTISPRWMAAGVSTASIEARYPASGARLAVDYEYDVISISLKIQGDCESVSLNVLLPESRDVEKLYVNGQSVEYSVATVENSRYLQAKLPADIKYTEGAQVVVEVM